MLSEESNFFTSERETGIVLDYKAISSPFGISGSFEISNPLEIS